MRCFIAIKLDESIKAELIRAQSFFKDLGGKVAWTKPEQMHLTIKFLGNVPENRMGRVVELLKECAAQVDPFEFPIEGLGAFPPSGRVLRVLWAGINAPAELVKLNDLCQEGYDRLGFPAEKRPYAPHLTIGRVKFIKNADPYRQVITEHVDFVAGVQWCENIILYSSDLKPTGAVHTPVETVSLGSL